ncbi:MAG: FixH family protein [Pseudomonadota bacterium]
MSDRAHGKTLKGWHVFLWLAGFFGVMFLANGIFVMKALSSFPGESERKSYRQGLDFNATLASRQAQAELGWTMAVGLGPEGEQALIVSIKAEDGTPIDNLLIRGVLSAGGVPEETIVVFSPSGAGRYSADLMPLELASGAWHLKLMASRSEGSETIFEARKTLTLP